jgi:hypothetical protein
MIDKDCYISSLYACRFWYNIIELNVFSQIYRKAVIFEFKYISLFKLMADISLIK